MIRPQIILIDDEKAFLQPFVEDLKHAFPDCEIVALTSESAFHKHVGAVSDSSIALVIADAILGPLDRGTDILLFCRQRLPHVRRMLMSNKASREDLEEAINTCALDGYIEKRQALSQDDLVLLKRVWASLRTTEPVNELAASKTINDLRHIRTSSRTQANFYKNAIKELLAFIFYPWLVSPRTEVRIRNETKAVDIILQNAARDGIFADLKRRYNSLLVPVETKNSKALHSSHFNQLEAYLTKPIGKWGILCFRGSIQSKHLRQIRGAHNEGIFLMLLTDSELIKLAKAKISGRQSREDYSTALDQFIRRKFDESVG
jgi:DNA-binding NarL/FixJ family response regulator